MYQFISDLPKAKYCVAIVDIKWAPLFFNSSVQKLNRVHKSDLERILLDIKKEG
jgi:hypothetical protein